MRPSLLTVWLLAAIAPIVAAWSAEDQEIFRLHYEIEAAEGPGVTFYDFLNIKPNANQEQLRAGYQERSRTLHPDKVKRKFTAQKESKKGKKGSKPGVHVNKGPSKAEIKAVAKEANERFTRLGLVNSILKGEGRERYDHFLANGFPMWKGTNYYYSRFRPGLFTVLTSLFVVAGGGFHYFYLYLSCWRQREFVGRYIKYARHSAWGDNLNIPGLDTGSLGGTATPPVAAGEDEEGERIPRNRKERRMMEKEEKKEKPDKKSKLSKAAKASPAPTPPSGATGRKKRVQAENGKILIVDSVGNVYLEQRDDDGQTQEYLLDVNEIPAPTFKDTALYRLPAFAVNTVLSRFGKEVSDEDEVEEEDAPVEDNKDSSSESGSFEVLEKVKTSSQNGNGKAIRRNKKNRG